MFGEGKIKGHPCTFSAWCFGVCASGRSGRERDTVFVATGRDLKVQIERCAKAWPVRGETDTSIGQRAQPMKCRRVLTHVHSTALNRGVNWPWSGATLDKVRA